MADSNNRRKNQYLRALLLCDTHFSRGAYRPQQTIVRCDATSNPPWLIGPLFDVLQSAYLCSDRRFLGAQCGCSAKNRFQHSQFQPWCLTLWIGTERVVGRNNSERCDCATKQLRLL